MVRHTIGLSTVHLWFVVADALSHERTPCLPPGLIVTLSRQQPVVHRVGHAVCKGLCYVRQYALCTGPCKGHHGVHP